MIGAEITIPLILLYILQAFAVPYQVFLSLKNGRTSESNRILVLSLAFFLSNTIFLFFGYHLNDEFGLIHGLKSGIIYAHVYITLDYLKKRISLKIESRMLHGFMLSFILLAYTKSLLSYFILPSKLLLINLILTGLVQLVAIAFVYRFVHRIRTLNGKSKLEEKLILFLLAVYSLSPIFFEIVQNELIRFMLVNGVFFSLFIVYYIDFSHKKLSESDLVSRDESSVFDRKLLHDQIDRPKTNQTNDILEPYDLSSQQLVVLKLILQGKNFREISLDLNIAHSTARKHGANIYDKVGVNGLKALRKKLKGIDISRLPDYIN